MRWIEIEQLHEAKLNEAILEEGLMDKAKLYIAAAALGIGTLGANIADKWDDSKYKDQPQIQKTDQTFVDKIGKEQYSDILMKKSNGHNPSYPEQLKGKEGTELKQTFKTIVRPIIDENNEKIKQERKKIVELKSKNTLSSDEQQWLDDVFKKYKVDGHDFKELLSKVDIIPTKIAVSQAALESGWATSRFAKEANALFGQKTTSQKSIDSETDKYAAFPNFNAAVESYMRNINSNPAYDKFRELRTKTKDPNVLLTGLHKYSTLGKGYIEKLKKVMSDI